MIDVIKINSKLNLRKISPQDAEEIFDLIDNNRIHLRTWLPFVDNTLSSDSTHAFIEQLQKPYSQELVFVICKESKITGLIGFKDIDKVNKKLEIGYWISKTDEGKGLVTAACNVVINKAFVEMEINRIQIKCGVGNTRSNRIPQKLGFKLEGIERAGEKHNEEFIDLETYSLLKSEWKK